jgi:IS4 transposase
LLVASYFYGKNDFGCSDSECTVDLSIKDPGSGKTLVFLTNNTALPALTIAALYKSWGQIELFFKWIKQHLRIRRFLATNENAVRTQVWCAIVSYVLIAYHQERA